MGEKAAEYLRDLRVALQKIATLQSDLAAAQERIKRLEAALRLAIGNAGHPDAAEGCRLVIQTAREALKGEEAEE